MKKFLWGLCVLLVLMGIALFTFPNFKDHLLAKAPALAKYEIFKNNEALFIRQIITKDSETSRTIMWQSGIKEDAAEVEYRKKDTGESQRVLATETSYEANKVTTFVHSATLEHLAPKTEYEYRIVYEKKSSPWYVLKTAGEDKYKALIFPDSQSSDYSSWAALVQKAWGSNKDAQFFVNLGDLVDNGEDNSQWRSWFGAVKEMVTDIPLVPVMGNHETYSMNWKVQKPTSYLNLFNVPDNGSKELKNHYYSFDYGDVHYTVLDTQNEELEDFYPGLLETQLAWLKNDLKSTTKKWKVVLMHKDVLRYPNKKHPDWTEGISSTGEIYMPVFDEYKVDLVYTAHLHTYRRRGHIFDFAKNEKDGPVYILSGVAGNVRYINFWKEHPFDEYVAPQPETDNYLTMEVEKDKLKITTFLGNGKKIDETELSK